jgi:hypothetical protein
MIGIVGAFKKEERRKVFDERVWRNSENKE